METKLKNENQNVRLGKESIAYRNASGDYVTLSLFDVTDIKIGKWKNETLESSTNETLKYKVRTIDVTAKNGETATITFFSPHEIVE